MSKAGNYLNSYKEARTPESNEPKAKAAEHEIFHGGSGNDPHVKNLHEMPYAKQQEILDFLEGIKPTKKPEKITHRPTIPEILSSIRDNVPQLSREGKISQSVLPAGFDTFSASDLQWQALHMAASASCRGLTKSGGHPGIHSVVLLRNAKERKTCREICSKSWADKCEAEVSIWGMPGKGKKNGQEVGNFYNYGCDYGGNGGNEATVDGDAILKPMREAHQYYFSYCCCSFY